MNLDTLLEPFPGELPVGEDCEVDIQAKNLPLLTQYLVERTLQKSRERQADRSDMDEAESRNARDQRDDGKRLLVSLESILKDVLKVASVSAEQIAKALQDKAVELLASRGKDLRLMPHLCAALIFLEGLEGYASVVNLTRDLIQRYPDHLYPLPDQDSPEDDWARANTVADLLSGRDVLALIGPALVIEVRQSGRLTLAELVGGVLDSVPATEIPPTALGAMLTELGPDGAAAQLARLEFIGNRLADLIACFEPKVLPVSRLSATFLRAAARIRECLVPETSPLEVFRPTVSNETAIAASTGGSGRSEMRSREDARRVIQDVIRFMEKIEPSHPAPLLLKRADRLMGMSFFDIIKDMAPNAVSDIERIAGVEPS